MTKLEKKQEVDREKRRQDRERKMVAVEFDAADSGQQ
jgi:hypothetical protein